MADIKFVVSVDSASGKAQIAELDKAFEGLARTERDGAAAAKESDDKHGGLWKQMAIGQAVYNLAARAAREFFQIGKDSIQGAIEQEQADRNLTAALELTGRTVNGNLRHYLDFAAAQQKVTKYTDDEIEKSQALLLQMTNLNQNGIDRAMKGAMGLASVMGMDLYSATMAVTKGMEGNYQALGRVGIKVDENLTAEQKQASLLEQLERLYGRATAEVDTFGGRMAQIKKNIDETKEALGTIMIEGLKPLAELVGKAAQKILDLIEAGNKARQAAADLTRTSIDQANTMRDLALKAGMTSAEYATLAEKTKEYGEREARATLGHVAEGKSQEELRRLLGDTTAAYHYNIEKLKEMIGQTANGKAILAAFEAEVKRLPAPVKEVGDKIAGSKKEIELQQTAIGMNRLAWSKWGDEVEVFAGILLPLTDTALPQNRAQVGRLASELRYMIGVYDLADTPLTKFKTGLKAGEDALSENRAETKQWAQVFQYATGQVSPAMKKASDATAEATLLMIQRFQEVQQAVGALFSSLGSLSDANRDRQLQNLDTEYQRRKKLIDDSLLSEEEKAAQLEALDKEFENRKLAVKRDAWIKQKNASVVEAVMNTAVGVTKAWATGGPILGPILAALTMAAGAIQIAAIKAQPMPLAKGGILDRPTLSGDGGFLAGEAGREAVIPIDTPEGRRALGRGATTYLTQNIYLGGKLLKQVVTEIVQDGLDSKRIRVKSATVN